MATTCFGRAEADPSELATFVVDAADVPTVAPAETPGEAPATAPGDGPPLALHRMTLALEGGLLMVVGPEGDPVPPEAFVDAAALRPEAMLGLPDGTAAPAARIAAVIEAQTLGRLGAAERGADWILAMLRDRDRPEAAAGDALRTERGSCTVTMAGSELTVACDAGVFRIVDVVPHAATGDAMGLFLRDGAPTSVAGLIGLMCDPSALPDQAGSDAGTLHGTIDVRADGLWLGLPGPLAHDTIHLARWATSRPNGPVVRAVLADGRAASLADLIGFGVATGAATPAAPAGAQQASPPRLEPDLAGLVAMTDTARLDFSAERLACKPGDALVPGRPGDDPALAAICGESGSAAGEGVAPDQPEVGHGVEQAHVERQAAEADLDPDSIVLVVIGGVPDGARLSAGVRDDDGSWSLSPLDLPHVTVSLDAEGRGGDALDPAGDLSITGIGLTEDGDLVSVSETVPLADYLEPSCEPAHAAARPVEPAAEPRMIPLKIDPRVWADQPFDALVIRDLPAGARLSAGAHDPAIDGWVLMPQDLDALAILPSEDLRADFSLTLMGVALCPGDPDATRVLARLPVTLA